MRTTQKDNFQLKWNSFHFVWSAAEFNPQDSQDIKNDTHIHTYTQITYAFIFADLNGEKCLIWVTETRIIECGSWPAFFQFAHTINANTNHHNTEAFHIALRYSAFSPFDGMEIESIFEMTFYPDCGYSDGMWVVYANVTAVNWVWCVVQCKVIVRKLWSNIAPDIVSTESVIFVVAVLCGPVSCPVLRVVCIPFLFCCCPSLLF